MGSRQLTRPARGAVVQTEPDFSGTMYSLRDNRTSVPVVQPIQSKNDNQAKDARVDAASKTQNGAPNTYFRNQKVNFVNKSANNTRHNQRVRVGTLDPEAVSKTPSGDSFFDGQDVKYNDESQGNTEYDGDVAVGGMSLTAPPPPPPNRYYQK